VRGIVNLYERRRVRLFVARDSFERFYSCLVFVPRDRYNTEVRERIERIVRERFGGTHVETQVQISDSMLARLHLLVRTPQGAPPSTTFAAIEAESPRRRHLGRPAAAGADRARRGARAPSSSRPLCARVSARLSRRRRPAQALEDIADLEALAANPAVPQLNLRARRGPAGPAVAAHPAGRRPDLISDILPMLENFGLRVVAEHPYQVHGERTVWIQDFELEARDCKRANIAALEPLFKEAFLAAWRGEIENDGFNRLLLCAGLERARNRGGARLLPLPAADRHSVQPGVHGTRARGAGADRQRAGAAVRNPVRARREGP
jgi:glutamate dehydrogenase